jgi:hypothetical protein
MYALFCCEGSSVDQYKKVNAAILSTLYSGISTHRPIVMSSSNTPAVPAVDFAAILKAKKTAGKSKSKHKQSCAASAVIKEVKNSAVVQGKTSKQKKFIITKIKERK